MVKGKGANRAEEKSVEGALKGMYVNAKRDGLVRTVSLPQVSMISLGMNPRRLWTLGLCHQNFFQMVC
jgi:hypothetical protein